VKFLIIVNESMPGKKTVKSKKYKQEDLEKALNKARNGIASTFEWLDW